MDEHHHLNFPAFGIMPNPAPMAHPPTADPQVVLVLSDPTNAEKRITIWNKQERRKISGNAAPMGKNLHAYLQKHPECEVFVGQDKGDVPVFQYPNLFSPHGLHVVAENSATNFAYPPLQSHNSLAHNNNLPVDNAEKRVTIWHKGEKRKISGNAAPMEKNLASYLSTHPQCEVYVSQDKDEGVAAANAVDSLDPNSDPSKSDPLSLTITPSSHHNHNNTNPANPHIHHHQQHPNNAHNNPNNPNNANAHNNPNNPNPHHTNNTGEPTFDVNPLTPPHSFSYDNKLEISGIPITSPALLPRAAASHHMDMSPVDSLGSFQTMDFSVGSHPHSIGRMGRGSIGFNNQPVQDQYDSTRHPSFSETPQRARSNTFEDFGVMGKPDGFD